MSAGVTLVMPLYNEAGDLGDVLASIEEQRYPHEALYLLVVDGGSTDASVAIATAWLARSGVAGRVLINPRRRIPTSLNLGFAHARRGDYVVRLDAHTTYDPDYVATIVAAFENAPPSIGCVGGPMLPAPTSRFDQGLVAALYSNPLGLGGAPFRRATKTARPAAGVYLGAWRPGVVAAVGGFDERWNANEDAELAARLREHGYATWAIPVRSAYRVKRGPREAIVQWASYGYWRAQTLRRHPHELRLRHLVPPVALGVAALLLVTPWRALVGVFYLVYAAAVCARRAADERWTVTLGSCIFFPLVQTAWTWGLLRGYAASRFRAPRTSRAGAGAGQN